jgi:hypothetical protein
MRKRNGFGDPAAYVALGLPAVGYRIPMPEAPAEQVLDGSFDASVSAAWASGQNVDGNTVSGFDLTLIDSMLT